MNKYYLDYWLKGVEEGQWIIKANDFNDAVNIAREQLDEYACGVKYEINGIWLKETKEE